MSTSSDTEIKIIRKQAVFPEFRIEYKGKCLAVYKSSALLSKENSFLFLSLYLLSSEKTARFFTRFFENLNLQVIRY